MKFPMIRKLLLVLAAIAALMPVPAMAERVRDLGQFHTRRTAHRPEQYGKALPHRYQRDCGVGIGDLGTDPAGHVMP